MSRVRIGIDFDNTIICYDKVFAAAAQRRGLVPDGWTGLKTDLRNYLQSKPGGELAWASGLNAVYLSGLIIWFHMMFAVCKEKGLLVRVGE